MTSKNKRTEKEFDDYLSKMVKKYRNTKRSLSVIQNDYDNYVNKLVKRHGRNFTISDLTDREWKTFLKHLGEEKAVIFKSNQFNKH